MRSSPLGQFKELTQRELEKRSNARYEANSEVRKEFEFQQSQNRAMVMEDAARSVTY